MTKCARSHENKIMEFLADRPVMAKVKSGGRSMVRHMRWLGSRLHQLYLATFELTRGCSFYARTKKGSSDILAAPVLWQRASVIIAMSKYVKGDFVNPS